MSAPPRDGPAPRWMRWVLWAAAVYNLAWGGLVVLWPAGSLAWAGMGRPAYPALWQCVGMMVAAYGIAYACAAVNPLRHWPVVLAGFVGKVAGPVGFVAAALHGELPWRFGLLIVGNDVPWLVPFGIILWQAARRHRPAPGSP